MMSDPLDCSADNDIDLYEVHVGLWPNARLSCRGRLGGRGLWRTGRAAPVSFSRWFGSFFLRDKSATQRTLTFAKVCEDRFYVKIELCCQLFANLANFCDN